MATKKLKLTDITIDGGTQIREKLDLATVDEYAEAYESGAEFPPLKVCYDGKAYWLYDGFHRWHARKKAEASHAEVEVFQGTLRDAKQLAAGANADHGLKRTNADKRAAVLVFLEDDEWAQWSDNKIAEAAGVSDPFVSKVRSELLTVSSSAVSKAADKPRVGRDGKSRKPPKRTAVSDFFDGKNAAAGNGQSKTDAAPKAAAESFNFDPHAKALDKLMRFADEVKGVHGRVKEYVAVESSWRSLKESFSALKERVSK